MADISQYLQAILEAVYGEQVRGSIHDAIDIINQASEVSISAGTAVSGPSSSSTGFFVGSMYINTTTYDLWKCVGTDSWQRVGNVDYYTITFDDGETETFTVTNGINGTNGSIWYKGTALTGQGTSIVGFPGVINDFYLNSQTGGVYVCTKTGGAMVPDAAEWDYVMTLSGGGGGSTILVIDNLTSASSTDALSANQGRVLKNLVDQKADSGSLAQVATSGNYSDLNGKPDLTQYVLKSETFKWIEDSSTGVGDTDLMLYDAAFKTDSKILLMADNGTGKPVKYTSITVTTGSCYIQFPALTAATTWAVGVLND